MSTITPMQVFCIPQPGKPDPNADYALGKDRPRVVQSGQKGKTCWYYGLIVAGRERYGKTAPADLHGRVVEREISSLRKKQTIIDAEDERLEYIEVFARELKPQLRGLELTIPNMKKYREFLNKRTPLLAVGTPGREVHDILMVAIEEFCAQREVAKFDDYIEHLKQKLRESHVQLLEQYLINRGISLEKEISKSLQLANRLILLYRINQSELVLSEPAKRQYIEQTLAQAPIEGDGLDYLSSLFAIMEMDVLNRLNFKRADWDPYQKIELLIRSLQQHGPHGVSGFFGAAFYTEPPEQLKDVIDGRPVFGWKVNAARTYTDDQNLLYRHLVVVVGATKSGDGKEYIFYLDPKDGSDPRAITSQRVYKTSYRKFIELARNFEGIENISFKSTKDSEVERVIFDGKMSSKETGLHYAYYLDSKKDT